MIVDPAIPQIPSDSAQREKLRSDLKDNKMVYRMIVSSDFKYTTIFGLLSTKLSEPDKHALLLKFSRLSIRLQAPKDIYGRQNRAA